MSETRFRRKRTPLQLTPELLGLSPPTPRDEMQKYRMDPVGYMRKVLLLTPTPKQEYLARLLLTPPHRLLVKASHNVGKTWLLAALVSWFYDTRTINSAVITTAPTARDVKDVLWAEIRRQRRAANLPDTFIGSKAPEMSTGEDHYAKGFTADRGESFVGRHSRYMLFGFDEAIGVDPIFYETTESMFRPGGEHFWLIICNPTDTSSQVYQEAQSVDLDGSPTWHVVTMAAIHHPNIQAQLQGQAPPYPSAVTFEHFSGWVAKWCDPILLGEVDSQQGDFEWPLSSGKWFRPGPVFDSRAMGRWPRQGTYGVWSDLAWAEAIRSRDLSYDLTTLPVIGCDLASFGSDYTEIHYRWGKYSFTHERHNGWLEDRTAGRLKEICADLAARVNALRPPQRSPVKPEDIPVRYDADGRGGALATHRGDFNFIPVRASSSALEALRYPNRRSELWFSTVRLAREGLVCLAYLDRDTLSRLRQQAMAPKWVVDSAGRQVVERKEETRKRLKYSPDGMDAVNLAYCGTLAWEPPTSMEGSPRTEADSRRVRFAEEEPGDFREGRESRGRGLFGRR